jgi:hypothetical protein
MCLLDVKTFYGTATIAPIIVTTKTTAHIYMLFAHEQHTGLLTAVLSRSNCLSPFDRGEIRTLK